MKRPLQPPPHFETTLQLFSNSTMYLVQQLGPTQFVLQESNHTFKVSIGNIQTCTCKSTTFPCIHILFVMLKIFKLDADSPLLFQHQLQDYDIERIVSHSDSKKQPTPPIPPHKDHYDIQEEVKKRPIDEESQCAICFDSLFESTQELCHCYQCGNHLHCSCMNIWISHLKTEQRVDMSHLLVHCPYCRSIWTEELVQCQKEKQKKKKKKPKKCICVTQQCHHCFQQVKVLQYKCKVCEDYYLCDKCFDHGEHIFHPLLQFQHHKWNLYSQNRTTATTSTFQIHGIALL